MIEEPQSSDEESPVPDSDQCKAKELFRLFQCSVSPTFEVGALLKRTCGLCLSLSSSTNKLAVGLSSKDLQLYQLSNGELTPESRELAKFNSAIREVKFFNKDPHSLLACTEDGNITLYDIRSNTVVHTFSDTTEGSKKTMTCCDVNQNDRVICASTDIQKTGDSFLLFFDIRERKYLGCYWECHSEDISNVRFHPTNPDLLASGSVDGLINVFDISKSTEDDAMQYCFNVECSVDRLNWHRAPKEQDWISCITTTNEFHLYDVTSQDPIVEFDRQKITEFNKRTSSIDCNVIDTYNTKGGDFFLLAGSNYNKGECLRTLKYENKQFSPHVNFLHNRQIVRASIYNEKDNCLITTGEGGLLTVWKLDAPTEEADYDTITSKNFKQKVHIDHRVKPY